MNILAIVCGALFTINVLAFAIAMRRHFRPPVGSHRGISAIVVLGPVSAIATLIAYVAYDVPTAANAIGAIVLYAISAILFFWASAVSGKQNLPFAFSTESPRQILSEGPYAYIRHPFYTAYSLTWVAGLVAIPTFHLTLLPVVLMLPIYWVAARREELSLSQSAELGQAYQDYSKRTGRFVPRVI